MGSPCTAQLQRSKASLSEARQLSRERSTPTNYPEGLALLSLLALLGLATSIWAEKFDHNAAITNFVIAPLSLLSGTFYVIDNLAPAFQAVSRANPFFYVISGFRYGFLGESDIGTGAQPVVIAGIGLLVLNLVMALVTYRLLKSGWKLKD